MDSIEDKPFGELLGQFRTEARLSQQKLADKLGVSRGTIVNWERGDNLPKTRGVVLELVEHLHLSDAKRDTLLKSALLNVSALIFHVPYHRNPFFTGREEILLELHHLLLPGATAALTQSQAISGLGGIGKTQTAVEYAYRYCQDYQAVLWLGADSREILFSEFVSLAQVLDLPEQREKNQTRVVSAVKYWLKGHRRWLLILDNIEDLLLVEEFLPPGRQGSVLLTTRGEVTEPIALANQLQTMTKQEGISFLLRRTKILALDALLEQASEEDLMKAEEIWRIMDGLPLALDQAGAYILETGCSLSSYLGLYQQRRAKLLERRGRFPSGHTESVATTFSLSFERVEKMDRTAADLLRACAFLAPDAIPEEFFTLGVAHLDRASRPHTTDTFQLNEMMNVVKQYSLIQRGAEMEVLSVHRLVQVVLIDGMNTETQRQWVERIVRAILHVFPDVKEDPRWVRPGVWRYITNPNLRWVPPGLWRYLPHIEVCAKLIEQYELLSEAAAELLYWTARHLHENFQYERAHMFYQRVLVIAERIFGSEHLSRATIFSHQARLYRDQGRYAQGEVLYQQALAIFEKVHGPEHPITATVLYDLAQLYAEQGMYYQAEGFYQQALARYERIWPSGLKPPIVTEALCNLALLYRRQRKYKQAETLLLQILQAGEEEYVDLDTDRQAAIWEDLADIYLEQGKYEQAETLYKGLLDVFRKREVIVMDGPQPEDPCVDSSQISPLCALARLYYEQGKDEKIAPLLKRALYVSNYLLGEDPNTTISALGKLAQLCAAQGEYEQAERLFKKILALCEEKLEPEHLNTALTLSNLAKIYQNRGQYEQAEVLYRRSLAIYEKRYRPEQLETVLILFRIALLYYAQNRRQQAESLYKRALTVSQQAREVNDPSFAKELYNLALVYQSVGKSTEAEPLYLQATAILERFLEPQPPENAEVLHDFAAFLSAQGNRDETESLYQRTLALEATLLELSQSEQKKAEEGREENREE